MFRRYWLILIALAILSPLGLLADGTAWGEWDADELKETLGYVPQGMERFKDLWQAIFPDYSMNILGDSTIGHYTEYVLSAIIGSALIYGAVRLITKLIIQQKKPLCPNK
jgi:cobalt/nickel transport protein